MAHKRRGLAPEQFLPGHRASDEDGPVLAPSPGILAIPVEGNAFERVGMAQGEEVGVAEAFEVMPFPAPENRRAFIEELLSTCDSARIPVALRPCENDVGFLHESARGQGSPLRAKGRSKGTKPSHRESRDDNSPKPGISGWGAPPKANLAGLVGVRCVHVNTWFTGFGFSLRR